MVSFQADMEQVYHINDQPVSYAELQYGYLQDCHHVNHDTIKSFSPTMDLPLESQSSDEEMFPAYFTNTKLTSICDICNMSFSSRNQLFKHLEKTQHKVRKSKISDQIIGSSAIIPQGPKGESFRQYNYLQLQIQSGIDKLPIWACLDTGCRMSIISKALVESEFSNSNRYPVKVIAIRGVGGHTQQASEALCEFLFFPTQDGRLARIYTKLHIIDQLTCDLILGMNVIIPNCMVIDNEQLLLLIRNSNNAICQLRAIPRGQLVEPSNSVEIYRVTPTIWDDIDQDICLSPNLNESLNPDINNSFDISPIQTQALQSVLSEFPDVFQDELGLAKQPPKDLLRIPIRNDDIPKLYSKGLYNLSPRDRAAVDEVFDKNCQRGVMGPAIPPNPIGWPVFVVYKEKKARLVVDLRRLNKYTIPDAYPPPDPRNVLAKARGCYWLSQFDLVQFFYQFAIHPDDVWKTAVLTHRDQEIFKVVQMGFVNSVAHTQRYMDKNFADMKEFFLPFVDDGFLFSFSFEDHLHHIQLFLQRVRECGLTLSIEKAHIGYHRLEHLGHTVDSIGLTTTTKKTAAIKEMRFPSTIKDLEYFIGFTGYYRHLIDHYAQLAFPFTDLKTSLLHLAPSTNPARNRFVSKFCIIPSQAQMTSFYILQDILSSSPFIHHANFETKPVIFHLFVDACREGFAAALHQSDNIDDSRKSHRPILFLSRLISLAEKNYWPTELETANIIWALRKLRLYLEQADFFRIYTDHQPCLGLAKAISLHTSHSALSNLRLHHWSTFISQYPQISFIHIPGSKNINADTLSRLVHLRGLSSIPQSLSEGSSNFAEHLTLDDTFRQSLIDGYLQDDIFSSIYQQLTKEAKDSALIELSPSSTAPVYVLHQNLLFFVDADKTHRLCIPRLCQQHILQLAHDQNAHRGIYETYLCVRRHYYFPHLRTIVQKYVTTCPSCQINKPVHHRPFGALQPIQIPLRPFEVLSLDFIGRLPKTKQGYDFLLTVTDKFSKAIILIPGCLTDSAPIWAQRFFDQVYRHWGLPLALISDRDAQFTSHFWQSLFKLIGTKILTTTAYHPSADGQAERTNQTVEIALRFYTNLYQNDWDLFLTPVQLAINTSLSSATKDSPSTLLFGQPLRTVDIPTSLPTTLNPSTAFFLQNLDMHRKDARDAMQLAIHFMLKQDKHIPKEFSVGDMVYLNLRQSTYSRNSIASQKLTQQHIGLFRILERIGKLAYRLDLPSSLAIHPVISISHLEPSSAGQDPFHRPYPALPPISLTDGTHRISGIIAKYRSRNRDFFLIRWFGSGPENDTWEPREHLINCDQAINTFEERFKQDSNFHPDLLITPIDDKACAIRTQPDYFTRSNKPRIHISTEKWHTKHGLSPL